MTFYQHVHLPDDFVQPFILHLSIISRCLHNAVTYEINITVTGLDHNEQLQTYLYSNMITSLVGDLAIMN